ncbi:thioredoxin [Sphingobacterium allocomposti]|uniref:Thioredoxin n=1 Tax=Sphingobacterium allocomposti TaxID=415956 RepID=A0A5S5D921_9SPHI|nr:thioredoxin [Sphingobacterium composti Yoo et al. 2007 non Ten et al. 2007]TYP92481.1 thioredoxin [Sphingobacterium composti Yoo et al. 2007 non Ten et al. 2007]HLS95901.1 thioredoxin [Sphingobacterium sp.]
MATFNDIINQHPLVLVDFSATWCGPCQMLGPILKDLKDHYGDAISIVKIDVDKNNDLAARYRVQGVPTMILYRNGEQVWRQSGVLPLQQLTEVVDAYV